MASPTHGTASKRRRMELGWEVIRDHLQPQHTDFDVIPWYENYNTKKIRIILRQYWVQVLRMTYGFYLMVENHRGYTQGSHKKKIPFHVLLLGCRSLQCSPPSTHPCCLAESWSHCFLCFTSSWQSSGEERGGRTCCAVWRRWPGARPATQRKSKSTGPSWAGCGVGCGLSLCEGSAHPRLKPSAWTCWVLLSMVAWSV